MSKQGKVINCHSVKCPFCDVPAWTNCRYPSGTDVGPKVSHTLRLIEAMKVAEKIKAKPKPVEDEEDEVFLGGWGV
jgi:hypothetical protein